MPLRAQAPQACVYTVSPPGLKAILPVNLTFIHKVVEYAPNMNKPEQLTKIPGGVIVFNQIKAPLSLENLREIIRIEDIKKPLAVAQREFSDSAVEILEKAA